MGLESLVSQPSIGIWKAKTMAIAIQYCAVAKIPVRSQASSSPTTPATAARVMIVYSGTAALPRCLAPRAHYGAHCFVGQQAADRDHREERQLLQVVDLGALLRVACGIRSLYRVRSTRPPLAEARVQVQASLGGLILFEDLAQPGFLVWAEVTVDQLCVSADKPLPNPLHNATGGQEEDGRRARNDRSLDLVDEVVVDTDVAKRAHQSATPCSDADAQEREKEDDAEQQPPERPVQRRGPD